MPPPSLNGCPSSLCSGARNHVLATSLPCDDIVGRDPFPSAPGPADWRRYHLGAKGCGGVLSASRWAICKGQYDKAIGDYDQAIRLDPKSGPAYAGRGFAWCGKGDWAKAIKDFDEAEHLGHRPRALFSGRGSCWLIKGDYEKAILDYDVAVGLDPTCALTIYSRGLAWEGKRKYDQAIRDFGESIRLNPKDALALEHRAICWAYKEDYAGPSRIWTRRFSLTRRMLGCAIIAVIVGMPERISRRR